MPLVQEQHCAALGAPIKDVPLSLFFLKTPWHWGPEEEPLTTESMFQQLLWWEQFLCIFLWKKIQFKKEIR